MTADSMTSPSPWTEGWRIEGHRDHLGKRAYLISHGVNAEGDGPTGYVGYVEVSEPDARAITSLPALVEALEALATDKRVALGGTHRKRINEALSLARGGGE